MAAVQVSTFAFGLIWFILWTGFSFVAHLFARKTLVESIQDDDTVSKWHAVVILTSIQLLLGGLVLKVFTYLLSNGYITSLIDSTNEGIKVNGQVSDGENVEPSGMSLYLSHAIATLATNASMAFVNAGSAFTIKAFEPITSAVLTSMLIGTKLQTHVIISLPLVVSGAMGFVWKPSYTSMATFGLGMAFVSNILFGVRNINLKLFHKQAVTTRERLEILQTASFVAAGFLLPIAAGLTFSSSSNHSSFQYVFSIISGSFHITYTIISTCIILKYTSIVGHATCNLLKRILVAIIFYVIGKEVISSTNWLMALVLLVGLAVYLFPNVIPFKEVNPSLSLIIVMSVVILLTACLPQTSEVATKTDAKSLYQLPPLDLGNKIQERRNDLHHLDAPLPVPSFKSYEEPEKANQLSIQAKTANDLITEAYRLHQEIFSHILGKYKRAVLVNVFQWFNKGDHLITIGQRRILERMGITLVYHCYYPGRDCDFSKVPKDDNELVVLVQGAGYIGHPSHEYVITTTIDHFPNNRLMVFPISVCHPTPPCTEIVEFANIFSKHKDAHIVLRDRYSYDLAQQYFKTTRNYLAPDSAFAVGSIRLNIVPVYDIIWLKRDDWESQKDAMPTFPKHLKVQVTDWNDDWMKQTSADFWEDHQLRTMTGVAFLARAKVVVSDRLHAHIMSQLMGKLNVVINSETKKQEHYYMTWEQSVKTSMLVNNNAEALTEAVKLLAMYNQTVTLV